MISKLLETAAVALLATQIDARRDRADRHTTPIDTSTAIDAGTITDPSVDKGSISDSTRPIEKIPWGRSKRCGV